MRLPSAGAEDGFVLIETVVAFLILAIALAVGIESVAQGAQSVRRADAIAQASLVARELAATRVPAIAEAGTWTGRHPNGSAWRMTALSLDDGRSRPVFLVSIDVQPPRSSGRPFTFQSFASGVPEE